MRFFTSMSLGVKLSILVLTVFGVLLLGMVILLNRNTQNLTQEVGGERVVEELNIISSRLTEVENELLVDIDFLVNSVSFFQAVGSRDVARTTEMVSTANFSLALDDITVVDGDGNRLVDLAESSPEEDHLLALALRDNRTTALLIEEQNGQVRISIAAVAPIKSATGNILGAIQLSHHVTNEFLNDLVFKRERVYLGLIYEDRFLARSNAPRQQAANMLINDIAFDPVAVQRAQNGEQVVIDSLIQGEGGVPHTVSYTPLMFNAEGHAPVIMILVDLEEIFAFQNTTLNNTIVIFVAQTLMAILIIYLTLYYTTIRPLKKLKAIAQMMTGGSYNERVPVTTQDEVGQLAITFNDMANAIQQREISLEIAREQAERADKVKSMFLASMSHELRTPLNAIINLTKFVALGMYGEVNEEQKDYLGKAESSGKHLLNLINDVLDISKIEAGSLELFVEDNVNIEEIIILVADTARGLLLEMGKDVTLSYQIDPNLRRITGDEQRIRQIIFNLVTNACKFTDEGSVIIKAYSQGDEIHIAVSDTGEGIPPEDQEAIFETFRQTKLGFRKGGGTGLGLPISRRLAEAHGGRLWLESTFGAGATFFVALPLQSQLSPTV